MSNKGEDNKKGSGFFIHVYLIGLFLLAFVFASSFVVAVSATSADVAYIYKKSSQIDQNVINVFNSMNLSVGLVNDVDLATTDFSNYRMIFVGDERFTNPSLIPIQNKSSIIANYYFGYEFGLTDRDGISKLAANSPLSINLSGNGILQVYTRATFPTRPIAIPYYYLSDGNKAPGMETVARTYTGNSNGAYNFGDVISYMYPRGQLVNGKLIKQKVCFYGIVESDYWTADAKKLFADCVDFAAKICDKNSDCGDSETGDNFCKNNNVYQNVDKFSCENPGTAHSFCSEDNNDELVEVCDDLCYNGACVNVECHNNSECNDGSAYTIDTCNNPGTINATCTYQNISCITKTDCGADGLVNDEFCQDNDVYQNFKLFNCANPGTVASVCGFNLNPEKKQECGDNETLVWNNYCKGGDVYKNRTVYTRGCSLGDCFENSNVEDELVQDCAESQICSNAECVDKPITCYENMDCGTDFYSNQTTCSGNNVFDNYTTFTCNNPGNYQSYCSNSTTSVKTQECGFCAEGECKECLVNSDCGSDIFSNNFCVGPSIFKNLTASLCTDYKCEQKIIPIFNKTCDPSCLNGGCVKVTCSNNSECDDSDLYTYDECNNPATVQSYCSHTPINCVTNNDCGFTGFFNSEFCLNNDLFKTYSNSTCMYAGTPESYCSSLVTQRIVLDCGDSYCGNYSNNYCLGSDVYQNRICYDSSCSGSACTSLARLDEDLVEECDFCLDGECKECLINSDCGSDIFSDNFCVGTNVYHNLTQFTCGNECSSSTSTVLVEECDICSNGACVPGVHDVGFQENYDIFGNSLRLKDPNNTELVDPVVISEGLYDIQFKSVNKGDFIENISLNCAISNSQIVDSWTSDILLNVSDYSLKGNKNNYDFTELCSYGSGFYNISCGLTIANDSNLGNNIISRQVEVVCGCSQDSDCGTDYYSDNYCSVTNVTRDLHDFSCTNAKCEETVTEQLVNECDVCLDGECRNVTCSDNSDCGLDNENKYCSEDSLNVFFYHQVFTCVNPGQYNSSCISSADNTLIAECLFGCSSGRCLACV